MDVISSFRGQFAQAHEMIEQAVADLTPEQRNYRGEGWNIQSIGGIYGHTVTSEDYLINIMIREKPEDFLFVRDGWAEKTGYDAGEDGQLSEKISAAASAADFDALREYGKQVYAATDAWLASLSTSDLDRKIHIPWMGGDMSVGEIIGNILLWHAVQHGGEICALKGVQGGQGLPF